MIYSKFGMQSNNFYVSGQMTENNGKRKTIIDLINQLKVTTNPVTYWAIKVAIINRLERKDLS